MRRWYLRILLVHASVLCIACSGGGGALDPDASLPADASQIDAGSLSDAGQADAASPDAASPDASVVALHGEAWCAGDGLVLEVNGAAIPIQSSGAFDVLVPESSGTPVLPTIATPPSGKECEVRDASELVGFDTGDILVRCWGPAERQLGLIFDTTVAGASGAGVFHTTLDGDGCVAPPSLVGPPDLPHGRASHLIFSGDGEFLVYNARETGQVFSRELFSATISGAQPTTTLRLNPSTFDTSNDIIRFQSPPGSSKVFYQMNPDGPDPAGMYYSDPALGVPESATLLTHPNMQPGATSSFNIGSRSFSEDGRRFVFRANSVPDPSPLLMWSVALDEPDPLQVEQVTPDPSAPKKVVVGPLSSDGRYTSYRLVSFNPVTSDLFLVDISGQAPAPPVKVHADLGADQTADFPVFSPAGNWLAFRIVDAGQQSLHVVDLSGAMPGPPQRVGTELVDFGEIEAVLFSPDGQKLVYEGEQQADGETELYVLSLEGQSPGTPVPVAIPNGTGRLFSGLRWSSDSRSIAFDLGPGNGDPKEPYWTDLSAAGPFTAQRIHVNLPAGSFASMDGFGESGFAPDGRGLLSQVREGDVRRLFFSSLEGGVLGTPVRIDPDLGPEATLVEARIHGDFVLFKMLMDITENGEILFARSLSGFTPGELQRVTAPPVQGSPPPAVRAFTTAEPSTTASP